MAGMNVEQFAMRIEGRIDTVRETISSIITDCLSNLRAQEKMLDEKDAEIQALKERLKKYEPVTEKQDKK